MRENADQNKSEYGHLSLSIKNNPIPEKAFPIRLGYYDSHIAFSEAATRGVLCKKVFLEISQNS